MEAMRNKFQVQKIEDEAEYEKIAEVYLQMEE